MNCRGFRRSHVAFVDGMMTDWQMGEMYRHLGQCKQCARLDVTVRRGLLVAKNLPLVRPSAQFMLRLEARLHDRSGAAATSERRGLRVYLGVVAAILAITTAVAAGLSHRSNAQGVGGEGAPTWNNQFLGPKEELFTVPFPVVEDRTEANSVVHFAGTIALDGSLPSP